MWYERLEVHSPWSSCYQLFLISKNADMISYFCQDKVLKFVTIHTGKSTLLNHLFHCNFREMDAFKGRWVLLLHRHSIITNWPNKKSLFKSLRKSFLLLIRFQTTKGIWLAHCMDIKPCTLVMDLEGTDGRERGEVGSLLPTWEHIDIIIIILIQIHDFIMYVYMLLFKYLSNEIMIFT